MSAGYFHREVSRLVGVGVAGYINRDLFTCIATISIVDQIFAKLKKDEKCGLLTRVNLIAVGMSDTLPISVGGILSRAFVGKLLEASNPDSEHISSAAAVFKSDAVMKVLRLGLNYFGGLPVPESSALIAVTGGLVATAFVYEGLCYLRPPTRRSA